jgi:molybdopterin molybdotransferase
LTSGGVSAGDADFVRDVLHRHADLEFWKIAIKPGRPLAFGKVKSPPGTTRTTYMFGLPGNPVATIVAFYVFVRDALLALAGATDCTPLVLSARCLAPIRKLPGREEYQRAVASVKEGILQVLPASSQGSAMMHSMCQANCLIVLPAQQGDVGLDHPVSVIMLDGLL